MQRLSAIDAISPAWEHTRELLLTPRSWRLLLKVTAAAFFAQMGGCSTSFSSPGHFPGHAGSQLIPHLESSALTAFVDTALLAMGFAALLIGLGLFYVSSRLQLVLFEVVARRDTRIAPIWRRYGGATWKWIGLKLLFWMAALVCLAPFFAPFVLHFIHNLPAAGDHGPQGSSHLVFVTALKIVSVFLVALLAFLFCYLLLMDFGIPSLALENTRLRETLRRIAQLVRSEPGPVALYVLMRFLLGLAWGICAYLAILLGAGILLIPLGGAGLALWAGLRHGGPAAHIVMLIGWALLAALLTLAVALAFIVLLGAGLTFVQAYAIFFLGGRYPLLGNLIEAGPGRPFTPPPVFPSRDEIEDDDSGGPSLPMNPAVA